MLELDSHGFLGTVTELREIIALIKAVENKNSVIGPDDRIAIVIPHVSKLIEHLGRVNARSALASAGRLEKRLKDETSITTYEQLSALLNDIESRFADHLSDIRLFVLNEQEAALLRPANELLSFYGHSSDLFSMAFPMAAFELEEAAKCLAYGRYTAAVFHFMRALELGVRALGSFLGIPDPTKSYEKNWGIILKSIRDKLDERWPPRTRLPGTEGATLEKLYATLDAIKNPWRNATMHVETIYPGHEAIHIGNCACVFMISLMSHCDEDGVPIASSPAIPQPSPDELTNT